MDTRAGVRKKNSVRTLPVLYKKVKCSIECYAVTALGALGLGKKYMQKITDSQMTKKATKNGKRPPKDVLRRNTVLDEVSWTKKMKRRVSYVEPENTSIDVSSGETGLELMNMMTNPTMDKSKVSKLKASKLKASKPIGRRRRSSAPSAFEPAPPPPTRRGQLTSRGSFSANEDVESPTSVEQHVGVDPELKTIKREFQEMKSEMQEIKRQLEALQKSKRTTSSFMEAPPPAPTRSSGNVVSSAVDMGGNPMRNRREI